MDIKNIFFTLTDRAPHISGGSHPEQFLGTVLESGFPSCLSVHAGGRIHAVAPYSYELNDFPFYMLLYTKEGGAAYNTDQESISLSAGSVLFTDLREHFRLGIASPSWDYDVVFLSGSTIDAYYRTYTQNGRDLYQVTAGSEIPALFDRLLTICNEDTDSSRLLCVRWLTDMLTEICLYESMKDSPQAKYPSYMLDMKKLLDESYTRSFALSDFEDMFGISKYRLCREFSHYFDVSPLQYLNMRRIEVAKDLLLSSNMPVHEVGSSVGIDNTNHFINLFKKYTGTTPFAFKQEAPASICALHHKTGVLQQ